MATRVPARLTETMVDLHFPLAGVDLRASLEKQPARDIGDGEYARSAPDSLNVRGFEPTSGRSRGGQRPGLSRFVAAPVVQDWIIQELAVVVSTSEAAQT